MPRLERRVDKYGFPIPGQIDDLPGRTAARDADQFGNVSFGGSRKRELSESGQRWKRRIIWFGIISVVVGLLLSSFAKPLWETYADARTQMGLRSLRDYDFDEARAHFDWALWADPEQRAARVLRGKALYALQELDAALDDLTFGIESNEAWAKRLALPTRSMIFYRQQKPAAAMRDADEAVKLEPNDISARNSRAYLCALLGVELKKGLDDIDRALKIDPDNAAFLDTRGYLLFKQGEHEAALRDLDRAIQVFEAELRDFEQHQRTNPGRRLNMSREQYAGALQEMRESLGVMYHHRGEVYEALKRADDAAAEKARGVEFGYNPEKGVF